MSRSTYYCLILFLAAVFGHQRIVGAQPPVTGPSVHSQQRPHAGVLHKGAPVVLDKHVLFQLHESVGSFSQSDRARVVSDRLQELANDPTVDPDSIDIVDSATGTSIVAGDSPVIVITDADSRAVGRTRHDLGIDDLKTIRRAIGSYREARSGKKVMLGVVYSILATLSLLIVLALLSRLFRNANTLMSSWAGTHARAIKIQESEVITVGQIVEAGLWLAGLLRLAVTFVILYFYLVIVFGSFPWTQGYAETLVGYMADQVRAIGRGFVVQIPSLVFITIIAFITRYVIRAVRFFFREIEAGSIAFAGFEQEWATPTYKIIRVLVLLLAAVAIFPYIPGSKSPAFQGFSVFLGILLSLGSTAAVANMVAGIVLTYMRPFREGDRVKIAETTGDVIQRTLLVTRIRTIKNVDVTIPNSMVLGTHIHNFSAVAKTEGLILHTTVTIGYDAPWRQIHSLLIAAAEATDGLRDDPAPFVLQTSLDDFYVSYQINAYTDQPLRMAALYSDLHQNIQDKFNVARVEIMSAHYTNIRDGNEITIPREYRSTSYEAPAFRIVEDNRAKRPT